MSSNSKSKTVCRPPFVIKCYGEEAHHRSFEAFASRTAEAYIPSDKDKLYVSVKTSANEWSGTVSRGKMNKLIRAIEECGFKIEFGDGKFAAPAKTTEGYVK